MREHPLKEVVLKLFDGDDHWDVPKLAGYLGFGVHHRAYSVVAKDLLGYLKNENLIEKDSQGWFRRAKKA